MILNETRGVNCGLMGAFLSPLSPSSLSVLLLSSSLLSLLSLSLLVFFVVIMLSALSLLLLLPYLLVVVLVSRDKDPVGYRNSSQASNLHSEQLPVGLCHGQGAPLLTGSLSRYPRCRNGLAPNRSGHGCLCRSVPRGASWYGRWDGFHYLRPQSPANKTLSQGRLQHRALQDPCTNNSPVPGWWP